jgi:hypothetical protein
MNINGRVIYTKKAKLVKNEHGRARYLNKKVLISLKMNMDARVIYTKQS